MAEPLSKPILLDETGKEIVEALQDLAAVGTKDHTQLINRDAADQHPMSAITGLPAALEAKADEADLTAEIARVEAEIPSVDNLATKAELQAVEAEIPSLTGYATETYVSNAVSPITAKIPAAATAQNQLADKAFVNSTVGTNTAIFRGTYQSLAALEAYSGEKTNNDYAFVIVYDPVITTQVSRYDRYKYNGTAWVFEYSLNNSSFTAAQWAAIQSGITAEDVALIATAVQPAALANYATKAELEAVEDEIPDITGLASETYVDTAVAGKQDIPAEVTSGTSITLADNTEYRLTNVTTLTLAYPSGNFECWLRITTASSGTITITLPSSQYIGDTPTFGNGETWELSIKDGYVIAHKVGA